MNLKTLKKFLYLHTLPMHCSVKVSYSTRWEITQTRLNRYDNLVKRFGNSQELAQQIMIAKALFNQSCANHWLKDYEDEIKCYDNLMQRFSTSS
ncbi:hypothetical protein SAMN06297164_2147 [Nitrosomonas ureae]|uniref:Uncharacterized protein n=1 Tax=Nitrosomonas ureae TaxID=44577 RepID=A0A286AB94_9PROT|nr:hypothetical protein SAMN06297164_2147 [Nitrosomonas ureae]